ncbi:hypothetical protein PoB_004843100 [Plakobranchus ocellatus]|uniref:Uncharacterized protein n=1 Tax=Plakobranchus ocellatus TaxID=259542 RepID=A0AAV4BF47_9GAST|nr:hypothetical protein PoB_004843100 [Plakobranchus ocellatus]
MCNRVLWMLPKLDSQQPELCAHQAECMGLRDSRLPWSSLCRSYLSSRNNSSSSFTRASKESVCGDGSVPKPHVQCDLQPTSVIRDFMYKLDTPILNGQLLHS